MPRSRTKELEIAKRRKDVVGLYLQGRYQWEIGEALGVDRCTVSRDLAEIQRQWRESGLRDFDADKARELERIDLLERTYWDAWERSQADREDSTTEKTTVGAGEDAEQRLKAGIRRHRQDGNPAFLAGVQWCISKRCQILGLDAPQRVSLNATEIDREIERLMADLGHSGAAAPAASVPDEGGRNADGADGAQ